MRRPCPRAPNKAASGWRGPERGRSPHCSRPETTMPWLGTKPGAQRTPPPPRGLRVRLLRSPVAGRRVLHVTLAWSPLSLEPLLQQGEEGRWSPGRRRPASSQAPVPQGWSPFLWEQAFGAGRRGSVSPSHFLGRPARGTARTPGHPARRGLRGRPAGCPHVAVAPDVTVATRESQGQEGSAERSCSLGWATRVTERRGHSACARDTNPCQGREGSGQT